MKYMYYKSKNYKLINIRKYWRVDNTFKVEYYSNGRWYRINSINYFSTIFKDNVDDECIVEIAKEEVDRYFMLQELIK